MADKKKLIPKIKQWEGGYSEHPNDNGGATNSGVTLSTFQSVYGKSKTKNDLKKMTPSQWEYIFTKLYWDKWKADSIKNQSIADILVDWVWMSGLGTIKKIQELIGTAADGIVGNKTISIINSSNQEELFKKIWDRRKAFYDSLVKKNPSQKVFMKGWMNRLNSYTFSK